ncbi:hypothetical protein [Ruegeria atlantica]|uniref:Uncharacterized protein n=1 Tax=Ruegeria atlantica TaxID=81569 RepID=A0A0P1EA17_9RHOB|nr:hypothetical protein [Ruegeria atlantica]CUH45424.1 hypothetical protein RUM4293_04338 [Ruegeria atlantica]
MSVRKRVEKLEQKAGQEFVVVVTLGEFYDKSGNVIPTDNGPPKNFEKLADSVVVSVSGSEASKKLKRREGETHPDFMRRFDKAGIEIGESVGATVTLNWYVNWI